MCVHDDDSVAASPITARTTTVALRIARPSTATQDSSTGQSIRRVPNHEGRRWTDVPDPALLLFNVL